MLADLQREIRHLKSQLHHITKCKPSFCLHCVPNSCLFLQKLHSRVSGGWKGVNRSGYLLYTKAWARFAFSHNMVSYNPLWTNTICRYYTYFIYRWEKIGPGIINNSFNSTQLRRSKGKIAWRLAASRIFAPSSASTVLRQLSMPLSYPGAQAWYRA